MDDYIPLILFVVVVIDLLAASKFSDIAKMKGHQGYFWWCFLLGLVGWLMVIALPDRKGPLSSNDCPQPAQGQGKDIHDEDLPEL